MPLIVFLIGAGALVWFLFRTLEVPPASPSLPGANSSTLSQPAPGPTAAAGDTAESGNDAVQPLPDAVRQKLLGSWQRIDAEYAIEIRLVNPDGVADARYFNPFNQRSIHVAKASLVEKAGEAEFFMELRDVGYPGSTYTLRYDAPQDQLVGIYFQAAMQERYEVAFRRLRTD